ncbi:MAG: fructose-bisphosphatase class III, partial [Clostridiales bacterium]|nr:fructose-bisphosphatase class III [Clostridiales bacterium]
YTLIYNSHGMRIKALQPFESVQKVLMENKDIESDSTTFETEDKRILVGDTDIGKKIKEDISDLKRLLAAYRRGDIKPN